MRKTSQLKNVLRRAHFTILILFVYTLGSNVPLPYAKITHQFAHLLQNSPITMLSIFSGANFQHTSLFMIGLNPLMIAILFIQLLMLTGLFGFDALSMSQMNIVQQILTLVLAVIQATTFTIGLHLTRTLFQMASVIIILTAGAMFVTWLGFMNMKFGIGGTVSMILYNIIAGSAPMILRAVHQIMKLPHSYLWLTLLLVSALALMVFWIAFSRAYYPLKTIQVGLSSKEKPVIIPLGLNMGAMMMYMVGMALLVMPTFLARALGPKSIFANPRFDAFLSGVICFGLFYFFSFIQFSPKQQARAFRNSDTYIPGIRPGKPTQRWLTKVMWLVCLPGAILNTLQVVFGMMGSLFLGKFAMLTIIPMNIVMIVMIMGGIRDSLITLLFPRKYTKVMNRERVRDN